MKKFFSVPLDLSRGSLTQLALSLGTMLALAIGLWVLTAPAARARAMLPAEMVQEGLPPGKTMRSATKPELLAAICAAVRTHRAAAPQIARVSIVSHREYAGDIVATVLRCGPLRDCSYVASIVSSATRTAPSEAALIDDAALAISPDCADAIQNATNQSGGGRDAEDVPAEGPGVDGFGGGVPTNQVPLPGSIGGGGGGFNPEEQLFLVCDNGAQRSVRSSLLSDFLRSHPGSFVGSCQPTPITNQ